MIYSILKFLTKNKAYIAWTLAIVCLSLMDSIMFHGTPPQEYKGLFGDWWHALKQISLVFFAIYGYILNQMAKTVNLFFHFVILALLSWLTHTIVFHVF